MANLELTEIESLQSQSLAIFYQLDKFTEAYIECALWSSHDESNEYGGNPLDDNYGVEDIHPDTLKQMVEDCKAFQDDATNAFPELDYTEIFIKGCDHGGHDFWLTRNGHGAGFWDGDYPELGDELTKLCKSYGDYDLYVGDDGMIYGYPG